jgi:hypothetical protein
VNSSLPWMARSAKLRIMVNACELA